MRRHSGAAPTADGSPAEISTASSCARSVAAALADDGHHLNRPFDKRLWQHQKPCPS